ncbi:MBL fold metallo-hydrolase [Octadecabacter sp.]|nr:MBL fold metallo-hydrolase [Octadecabacter sp.]
MKYLVLISALLSPLAVFADENIPDQYPASMLYSKPVEYIPGVFSAIGATGPPTYENAGHNNNLSFIVTGEGVVVVNGGGSYLLAKALHDEIKAITDQEILLVVGENGQGHAMLGNSYWAEQGVKIIAHEDAATEFEEHGFRILESMKRLNRERGDGTFLQGPTETFTKSYTLALGEYVIEVRYLGPSHSAGDVVVWLPNQSLVIAGDMAFHERVLPVFEDTYTLDWLETWDTEFEALNATFVVPGHGHPTNMDQVRRYTKSYLEYLRREVGTLIDNGGGLAEAYYIDQSPYAHLDTFEELATKNAGRVFEQMEFE